MKTISEKIISCLVLLFAIHFTTTAQINSSKIELGINAMTFIYQGDLSPSRVGSFKTINAGASIYLNYKLNHLFYLRTVLALGRSRGDDSKYSNPVWRKERNFKFNTPITEISESVIWNITNTSNDGGRRLSPYISAEIAYSFLHIRRDYSNYNSSYFSQDAAISAGLAADTAHSMPKGLLVVPIGAGIRYALTKNLSLNAESAYRINWSDYLDGFSKSANPDKKDHYFTNAIGLVYSFNKKNNGLNCPTFQF